MRRLAAHFYLGLVLLAAPAGEALAASFSCPPTVMDKGAVRTATGVDPPWALHDFRYVEFFDGEPNDLAEVFPDEELKPDRIVQTWRLTPSAGRKITALCHYTGTRQTKRVTVPPHVKSCTLVTLRDRSRPPALTCE